MEEMHTKFWMKNLKEKDHLEDVRNSLQDDTIIKHIFK
jgi:hypothetical protein